MSATEPEAFSPDELDDLLAQLEGGALDELDIALPEPVGPTGVEERAERASPVPGPPVPGPAPAEDTSPVPPRPDPVPRERPTSSAPVAPPPVAPPPVATPPVAPPPVAPSPVAPPFPAAEPDSQPPTAPQPEGPRGAPLGGPPAAVEAPSALPVVDPRPPVVLRPALTTSPALPPAPSGRVPAKALDLDGDGDGDSGPPPADPRSPSLAEPPAPSEGASARTPAALPLDGADAPATPAQPFPPKAEPPTLRPDDAWLREAFIADLLRRLGQLGRLRWKACELPVVDDLLTRLQAARAQLLLRREAVAPAVAPAQRSEVEAGSTPAVYVRYRSPEQLGDPGDFYEPRNALTVARLIQQIVAQEAPVLLDVVARRVTRPFGIKRRTDRVRERIMQSLVLISEDQRPQLRGDVFWAASQDPATYHGFRLPGAERPRNIAEVPLEELSNAAAHIGAQGEAGARLIEEIARVFECHRVGRNVRTRIERAIELARRRSTG